MSAPAHQDCVDEDTILSAITHTRMQIDEARRLRDIKIPFVNAADGSWLDRVISQTEISVNKLAQLLEPSRIERQTRAGRLSVATRLRWALGDGQKVRAQYSHLTICHQSLTTVIAFLHSQNPPRPAHQWGPAADMSQIPPPSYALGQVLTWRRSRSSSRIPASRKVVSELE